MIQSILYSQEKKDLNIHNIKMDECFTLNTNNKLYKTIYSNLHKKYIIDNFSTLGWSLSILLFTIAIIIGLTTKSWIIGILSWLGVGFLLNYFIVRPSILEKHKDTKLPLEQINLLIDQIFKESGLLRLGNIFKKNKITNKVIENKNFNVYANIKDKYLHLYFIVDELIYLKNIDITDIVQFTILKDENIDNSIKELKEELHKVKLRRDLIEVSDKIKQPILSTQAIEIQNLQRDIDEELKEKNNNLHLLYIVLANNDRIILNNLNIDTVKLIEKKFTDN